MWPKKETNPYIANPLIYPGSEKSSQATLSLYPEAAKEEEKKKLKPVCYLGLIVMLALLAGYCPYIRHILGF